jgi:two-component system, NarL family, response regulator LiaR
MTQAISVLTKDLPQPFEQTQDSSARSGARSKIAVLVVAGERLFGLGVARLLGEDENLDVIGVWDGDADLPSLCASAAVDVALVDLELSRIDGIDLVRRLAVECPSTRSLVLTSNPDWRVRTAMIAGAAGVLLKDTSPEATRAAVVSVHLGDQVLCSEAAQWVLGEQGSVRLTKRESDVLRVLSQGADNAEIARQLQLGQKTVRNYISRLYRKLDVDSRAQLSRYLARSDNGAQANED